MAQMRATLRNGSDPKTKAPRWKDGDPSARLKNFRRQSAVALVAWCVKQGRARSNPLATVPKMDERIDRRRVRRPLTDDELARLLAVARERDREMGEGSTRAAWYTAAALAGLRRGDLERLTWAAVDLEGRTITIREGKAKRTDTLPVHPQLADELAKIRPGRMTPQALARARVFPRSVTSVTVRKDLDRAGIGPDAEGRVADLHALRATLGTTLARQGVAPQLAQRMMRHASYQTTLNHDTVLGLTDTAKAMDAVPAIGTVAAIDARKTGTDDADHAGGADESARNRPTPTRLIPRPNSEKRARISTTQRENGVRESGRGGGREQSEPVSGQRSTTLSNTLRENGAEGNRTLNFQLAKLALYQLSYRPGETPS